jgi:hypothetical protein
MAKRKPAKLEENGWGAWIVMYVKHKCPRLGMAIGNGDSGGVQYPGTLHCLFSKVQCTQPPRVEVRSEWKTTYIDLSEATQFLVELQFWVEKCIGDILEPAIRRKLQQQEKLAGGPNGPIQ